MRESMLLFAPDKVVLIDEECVFPTLLINPVLLCHPAFMSSLSPQIQSLPEVQFSLVFTYILAPQLMT